MRTLLRYLFVTVAGLLVLAAVACGGGEDGDGNDSSSNLPGGEAGSEDAGGSAAGDVATDTEPGDAAVFNAIAALGQSADDFDEQVESLQGEMTMQMSFGEMEMGIASDFAFNSPDQMYMKMSMSGGEGTFIDLSEFGEIELLLLGDEMYMNMPPLGGWFQMSMDELGIDAAQYQELMEGRLPLDYSEMIESLGEGVQVQDLGVEALDGGSYRHLRMETDMASLMASMSSTFEDAGFMPLDGMEGPVVVDLWLDDATGLPHKLTATATMEDADPMMGDMSFAMSMIVHEYNGVVVMPEPPSDARSMEEFEACLDIESAEDCGIDGGLFEGLTEE
jgi:hypothetical protein